ncbi:MAG: type IV secretion system DNA-binding domain-containing protein [bacterium]|nr:type IV secretion system DNA-binding domain-containing protein [bacterium]
MSHKEEEKEGIKPAFDIPEIKEKKDVVYFGRVNFRNTNRLFGFKRADRRQHTYVVGKTGTGKTALLNNMVIQDIANGEGLCVVDPLGVFAECLVEKMPVEMITDVIYFNPADPDFAIGFNVLEIADPQYKHLVASGLMGIFTKIWANVWSARMEYILNNAVLALMDTPGSTLMGLLRVLTDSGYRQKVIANIKDPVVKSFWVNEFEQWRDQFRNEAIAPIQNKVGQFLSASVVRNIVGQSKSTINIFDIMNSKKILIVNVSKGKIGEDNSALLGAMMITKIQLAAMERVRIPEEERKDFYLYVDEFQNFATDSFASILSEARKYRLDLTISHQYIGQLESDVSSKVRDAVFGNVGTMIVFRVGADDAEFLEKEFTPEFEAQDFVNLPNYNIYLKLMVDGVTSRPFSAVTLPPFKVQQSPTTKEEIIAASRYNFSRPREETEEEINNWSTDREVESSEIPTNKEYLCDICGKPTHLNFKPTEGKPIYCRECLSKIQNGQLAPLPEAPDVGRIKPKYFIDLGDLGIEMERKEKDLYLRATAKPTYRNPSILNKAKPVPWQSKSSYSIHDKDGKEKPKGISLKELGSFTANIGKKEIKEKPNEEKTEDISESTISGLQDDLRQALGKILD